MKKILLLASLVLPLFMADGCKKEKAEVHVKSIIVEPSELELSVGENQLLTVTVLPKNASDKTVVWSSSDSQVAKVEQDGTVTARMAGAAVIKATSRGGGIVGSCSLTVKEPYRPVVSISLDKETLPLKVGGNFTLTATTDPENATDPSVTWASDNTDVAMVDAKGKVVGVAPGTTKVTATSVDNPNATAVCNVEVTSDIVSVTGIGIDKTEGTVEVGKTLQITATVSPANATDQRVRWTSSDEKVATVGNAGLVTGVAPGTAEITASTQDGGFSQKCIITVIHNKVTAIEIENASASPIKVEYGSSLTLKAIITPPDASNKALVWKSSNTNIAFVSSTDAAALSATISFSGSKTGDVTIDVSSSQTPETSASQVFSVWANPTAISLPATAMTDIGGTVSPSVTFTPSYASETGLTWSSSNTKVATVDAEGKVTGVAQGTATITAKSTAVNGLQASCKVTVLGENKVSVNGAAAVTYATGALASVLSAAGTVTSLSWESGLIAGDDINAISEHRSTIESLDLANVAFKVGDTYKNTSQECTIAENALPDYFCFNFPKLQAIVLPHVETIGQSAFNQCRQLSTVTVQSEVKKVMGYAFMYCNSLVSLDLSNITEINGPYTFNTMGLEGVVDLSSLEIISGDSVFGYSKKITKIILGKNLKSVGFNTFSECTALTSIEIPAENPYLSFQSGAIIDKDGRKLHCSAPALITGTYTVPVVKIIAQHAFDGVPATAFVIPEGIETLEGRYNFGHIQATEITLPSTVKSVGAYAFAYSNNLKSITVKAETPPACGKSIFTNCGAMESVFVPAESVDAYKKADGWKGYASMIKAIQ